MNFDNADSRRAVEHCYRTTSLMINPILHWTEDDVWEFLHYYGCCGNPLYQCGEKRIGCIGCPLASSAYQKRSLKELPEIQRELHSSIWQNVRGKKTSRQASENQLADR